MTLASEGSPMFPLVVQRVGYVGSVEMCVVCVGVTEGT